MRQSELAPHSADPPPDFSGSDLAPIARPIGSVHVPAAIERNVAMPAGLPRLLSDLGVSKVLEVSPIVTNVAKARSQRVKLSSGLRSYRLVMEYLSFRTPDRRKVLVNTLQRAGEIRALHESDLLCALLYSRTERSWLLRALVEHRQSEVWRSHLSLEQIAALAGVSPREVSKHV